jgi:hypothetical protein
MMHEEETAVAYDETAADKNKLTIRTLRSHVATDSEKLTLTKHDKHDDDDNKVKI